MKILLHLLRYGGTFNMKALQTTLLTTVLGLALTATSAMASTIPVGSIAFGNSVASYAGGTLSTATSITLAGTAGSVTQTTGSFACTVAKPGQPDCTPAQNDPFGSPSPTVITPLTFLVPPAELSNFISWGDGGTGAHATRYSFDIVTSSWSSGNVDTLTLYASGVFHDTAGVFSDSSAYLLYNFTQSGGGEQSISGAGSISIPDETVPEPTTLALLGPALFGLGLIGRKRLARR
jgi:hypothetical protein